MSKWSDIKMYDLSIPIGVNTPPWPTYEPLQMKFFKRLAPNGVQRPADDALQPRRHAPGRPAAF